MGRPIKVTPGPQRRGLRGLVLLGLRWIRRGRLWRWRTTAL